MELQSLDWFIITAYLIITLVIGLSLSKKAGRDLTSFFLGGRNLPWWIAGTSMVATTFAADTPLLITELVANNGISGNWLWWNGLIGGMLATFFFARLWRKANIITDVEFTELRYSGKEASFLRGFKAIYLGIFMNSVVIAWVNIALATLLQVFFDIPKNQLIYFIAAAMFIVMIYSSLSGLLGVVITDFFQFIIAMSGCIVLAVVVLNLPQIGGITGLKEKLSDASLNFFPHINFLQNSPIENMEVLSIGIATFLAFIGIQWWASWYPGAEPGGGGYIAQRMMSAKNEKHAVYSTLFFQIAHYCLRPWPWIIVALCALVLYPDLGADDKRLGYVYAMKDFLPVGLKGLLLVAFFAAYMSTISTQLNWGASYIVNDLYKRFIRPEAGQKKLVLVSRINTFLLMVVSLIVTSQLRTLEGAFHFMIECGAGLGAVLILRWYWWRINAWSEIAATIAPFIAFSFTKFYWHVEFPYSLFITVGFTTCVWLLVTFATKPTERAVLENFYQKIKPGGNWKPFDSENKKFKTGLLVVCWLSAVLLAYSILFLIGKIIFMEWTQVGIWGTIAFISAIVLYYFSKKVKLFEE
ncbi:MAG: Na+:solute symporter [Cytophagales bacterium]|nr:Na+:solute symporter [Cytophagales bacterium]